jgi:hypothetical protein
MYEKVYVVKAERVFIKWVIFVLVTKQRRSIVVLLFVGGLLLLDVIPLYK